MDGERGELEVAQHVAVRRSGGVARLVRRRRDVDAVGDVQLDVVEQRVLAAARQPVGQQVIEVINQNIKSCNVSKLATDETFKA